MDQCHVHITNIQHITHNTVTKLIIKQHTKPLKLLQFGDMFILIIIPV